MTSSHQSQDQPLKDRLPNGDIDSEHIDTLDNYIFSWLADVNPHRQRRNSETASSIPLDSTHICSNPAVIMPSLKSKSNNGKRNGSSSRLLRSSTSRPLKQGPSDRGRPSIPRSAAFTPEVQRPLGPSRSGRQGSQGNNNPSGRMEHPKYRSHNLSSNNIQLGVSDTRWPEKYTRLGNYMGRKRESPEPHPDQLLKSKGYTNIVDGCTEEDVRHFFVKHIQQDCEESDRVKVSHDAPMRAEWRIGNENNESLPISIPKPDILYGYQAEDGFKYHRTQLASLGRSMASNGPGNILPFFVVELKSQGPGSRGSLWVAENQVLGGASSCVSMVSYLNDQLRATASSHGEPVHQIDTATFSVAMSNTEARLYISWEKEKFHYYTQRYKSFALAEPEQYLEFRRYVRNIIDWGAHERLDSIRHALDDYIEDIRVQTPTNAKGRERPP